MNKIVIFGAGNIGRSFIGNIFSSNGLKVTFVDANEALVKQLNLKKKYRIIVKRNNKTDEEIQVENIEAIHSSDTDKIIKSLLESDICSTSVGQAALSKVIPIIAESIKIRNQKSYLDIIIAENIRNGADYFRKLFKENGLKGDEAGLIETSIGKMVPIMAKKDLASDFLILHAEEYNTLILDQKGFKNYIPDFPEIKAVENVAAWVDRKLFIHNLGHAASAYLGFIKYPGKKMIAEVLEDSKVELQVRKTMLQAAGALFQEYSDDFTWKDLTEHIDDLLFRFKNKALGDTVFRVGRDLLRKLGRDDRILGSARICIKHQLPYNDILDVFYSALKFSATNHDGEALREDVLFRNEFRRMDMPKALVELCGLDPLCDNILIEEIVRFAKND